MSEKQHETASHTKRYIKVSNFDLVFIYRLIYTLLRGSGFGWKNRLQVHIGPPPTQSVEHLDRDCVSLHLDCSRETGPN